MGPVRNGPPETMTRPPPDSAQAWMARPKDAVQSITPSPTAPYFDRSKSREGKAGGRIRDSISEMRIHGSSAGAAKDEGGPPAWISVPARVSVPARRKEGRAATVARKPRSALVNSRRLIILV